MLKVEINKGETSVEASGKLPEICADITALLSVIYDGLNDEDVKKDFVFCIKKMAKEELFTKKDKELQKIRKQKEKECLEELIKEMPEDVIKMLKELIK